jgi:hypothetical protein
MKTILEIFYVRIMGNSVRYQRRTTNLSRKGGNPDALIRSLIHEKRRAESSEVEEQEFIVHSTSWRYTQPDKVILTYVAYSDELELRKGFHSLSLKKLRMITKKSHKPRSRLDLEKKVVSHAMRHIAFLIQEGDKEDFKSALKPETVEVFESLWISLAGKVF